MPSTPISLETRDRLKSYLADKARTRRPSIVEDALKAIRPSVKKILKRGYIYSDVVAELEKLDIAVTEAVVEAFYAPKPKGRNKKKTPERFPELTQLVTQQQRDRAIVRFEELATTRKGLTLRELVVELAAAIDDDLQAGWQYEDIARWIRDDFSVQISSGTLKRYHGELKRQRPIATESAAKNSPKPQNSERTPTFAPTPKPLPEPTAAERSTFAGEFNL